MPDPNRGIRSLSGKYSPLKRCDNGSESIRCSYKNCRRRMLKWSAYDRLILRPRELLNLGKGLTDREFEALKNRLIIKHDSRVFIHMFVTLLFTSNMTLEDLWLQEWGNSMSNFLQKIFRKKNISCWFLTDFLYRKKFWFQS